MQNPNPQYQYQRMTAAQTLQIKKTSGLFGSFIPSATGTIAAYDNAAGDTSGNVILATTAVTAGVPVLVGAQFIAGLTIVLASSAAGTVFYN